jgi:hypothetical protein
MFETGADSLHRLISRFRCMDVFFSVHVHFTFRSNGWVRQVAPPMPSSPPSSPAIATLTPRSAATLFACCASYAASSSTSPSTHLPTFVSSSIPCIPLQWPHCRLLPNPTSVSPHLSSCSHAPLPGSRCSHTIHVFELLDLGLHNARKLFDGMAQRDVFTYNAML